MAKISMQGKGNGNDIAELITREMESSGMSTQLVDSITRQTGDLYMHILVFEKYYMRSSNRASLTVVVTDADHDIKVDAIGAGGGQGVFFRFSWGAEESFVSVIEEILRRENFTEI
ncbi:DUF6054 family protein [Proteiniclasticum sp.]|uniref:DUF6054 family protein n=1 Tax=Proteiniclasticum sp. TaxID=2053595 RepID=UPI0028A19F49|nr:DUF6054 family protein [Proteiniclasticum sp.]